MWSCTFNLEWNCSHITPVHKGGAFDNPGNYRPISVVPVLAKLLERTVSTQLEMFLEQNNLSAYHMGKSTEDILLLAVDHIVHSLDVREAVCAAFLKSLRFLRPLYSAAKLL